MELVNIEIKAKCNHHNRIRQILKEANAEFWGVDHQIDTYFKVQHGRLKMRKGDIENFLIHYYRENKSDPKQSKVMLYKTSTDSSLTKMLTTALGVLVIVDKLREIYFIDNVKIHLDKVKYLGTFVEIEAIDKNGSIGKTKLQQQCEYYLKKFQIKSSELVPLSYSDMLLQGCKRF